MYPLFDMINICGAEYLFEIVQEFHVDKFHIKGFHIERKKTVENVMDVVKDTDFIGTLKSNYRTNEVMMMFALY
jgi:hypothetical protein